MKNDDKLDDLNLEEDEKTEAQERIEQTKAQKKAAEKLAKRTVGDKTLGPLTEYTFKDANGKEQKLSVEKALDDGILGFGANKQVGFVTDMGKLYKCSWRKKSGKGDMLISSKGNLVMPKCTACGYRSGVASAINGECTKCGNLAATALE